MPSLLDPVRVASKRIGAKERPRDEPACVRGYLNRAAIYDWYKTGIQDQAENEVSDCEAICGSRRT